MTCPLCTLHTENFIWTDGLFGLLNVSDNVFPCYFRLICRKHVTEVTDLTPKERARMWQLLETIESCIREIQRPVKVNWAQFGNQVPHLHWHIIARWVDDDRFPASPWEPIAREVSDCIMQERLEKTAKVVDRLHITLCNIR